MLFFFQVSSMKFLNSLLNTSPNLNSRVYLQHELETAGLDVNAMEEVYCDFLNN